MAKAVRARTNKQYSVSKSDWKHGSSLEVYDGAEIVGDRDGMAVALIPKQRSSKIFKWSIEILNDLVEWLDLGFIYGSADQELDEEILEGTLRDIPSSRVLSVNPERQTARVSEGEPKSEAKNWKTFDLPIDRSSAWLEGDYIYEWDDMRGADTKPLVTFTLNAAEKICDVKYWRNRKIFSAKWTNLPDGEFYPAVSFEGGECSQVRLTLLSGFNHNQICRDRQVISGSKSNKALESDERDAGKGKRRGEVQEGGRAQKEKQKRR